jgi:hypothetical protein
MYTEEQRWACQVDSGGYKKRYAYTCRIDYRARHNGPCNPSNVESCQHCRHSIEQSTWANGVIDEALESWGSYGIGNSQERRHSKDLPQLDLISQDKHAQRGQKQPPQQLYQAQHVSAVNPIGDDSAE